MIKYIKKRYLFFAVLTLMLALKTNVLALDSSCTQNEQMRLRKLVDATQITYEFYNNTSDGTYGFKVTISGFTSDFYVYNQKDGTYFNYNGDSTVTNDAFSAGTTYVLPFHASDQGACKGYLIATKYVTLPSYNVYSSDPLCNGHDDIYLCKKFVSLPAMSYSEFVSRLQGYIKGENNTNSNTNNNTNNNTPTIPKYTETTWDKISDFMFNSYMYFLIFVIVSGTTGIIVIEVRKRRSIL